MLSFKNQTGFYKGKVRDVYMIADKYLAMVVSDRISAFDVVLPRPIPYKGQVLNQIAAENLEATKDIVPNWVIDSHSLPNVTVGKKCAPFAIEMVIRGHLAGHAWRTYKSGDRTLCGVPLPDGLKENDFFSSPIITPSTKAHEGHDEDISKEDIIAKNIVTEEDYNKLEAITRALFDRGRERAAERGLILVDTKYEFGKIGDQIYLIDEIHTPDSSRYFYADTYETLQIENKPQRQLSKEFVREWLMDNGFQGKENQQVPEMTNEKVEEISQRYIELYEKLTGKAFEKKILSEEQTEQKVNDIISKII